MLIALPAEVRGRLEHIERTEGVPALEVCHQAIALWSQLDASDRQRMGAALMDLATRRAHR